MKVGSLVECVEELSGCKFDGYNELPIKKEIYTVRGFMDRFGVVKIAVYLDELCAGYEDDFGIMTELPYPTKWFRELQPPMDLTELMEEVNTVTV